MERWLRVMEKQKMEIVRPGRKLKYSNWEANVVCKL
jgi:hypothetical protein